MNSDIDSSHCGQLGESASHRLSSKHDRHFSGIPLSTDAPAGGGPIDFWRSPAVIAPNNFVYKSLSNWAFNIAVGCSHACRFCYVPSAATIKQGAALAKYGVEDPDAEWGNYVLQIGRASCREGVWGSGAACGGERGAG